MVVKKLVSKLGYNLEPYFRGTNFKQLTGVNYSYNPTYN